jgi:hypothetical protein
VEERATVTEGQATGGAGGGRLHAKEGVAEGRAASGARGGGLQAKEEEAKLRRCRRGSRAIRHTLWWSFYFIFYN